MNPNQSAAFKSLEQAQQALKSGDKNAARQFANQAAQAAPELEEVWLMMGALASARGSVAYLEKAAQINPQSERAKKGLAWARARLEKETLAAADSASIAAPVSPEKTQPQAAQPAVEKLPEPASYPAPVEEPQAEPTQKVAAALNEPKTQPRGVPVPVSQPALEKQPVAAPKASQPGKTARSSIWILLLLLLLCLVAAWAVWQGATPAAAAFFSSSAFTGAEHGPAWANIDATRAAADATQIAPQVTAAPGDAGILATSSPEELALQTTASPSADESALSTATETLTSPTETQPAPAPTATQPAPAATETGPTPQDVVLPTFTPVAATATQELASVDEQPSPTPLPTDTAAPLPTQFVPPTPNPGTANAGGGGRWIDVDLTNQMVYAYEGNTLVNSFLVSTGTWQHPTVTGQYYVYLKYRYKDMSGPGYYLPNVPFTMFFYQGYAIHGTYWHSNFGTPMSHGCVNMTIPDSEWIYNFATVGTLVNVHY